MRRFLRALFGRRTREFVDLPEIVGRRLSLSEVKAAMGGQQDDARIQTMLQLLVMTRQDCLGASKDEAWKAGNPAFHLGGVQALDDLLHELILLLKDKPPSDDVKTWFPEK